MAKKKKTKAKPRTKTFKLTKAEREIIETALNNYRDDCVEGYRDMDDEDDGKEAELGYINAIEKLYGKFVGGLAIDY